MCSLNFYEFFSLFCGWIWRLYGFTFVPSGLISFHFAVSSSLPLWMAVYNILSGLISLDHILRNLINFLNILTDGLDLFFLSYSNRKPSCLTMILCLLIQSTVISETLDFVVYHCRLRSCIFFVPKLLRLSNLIFRYPSFAFLEDYINITFI